MFVKEYEGKVPEIESGAYTADSSSVIGDVKIEKDVNIWYGAVVRGDLGPVHISRGTAIEDNSVVHAGVRVGKNCVIGHNVVLNGCNVGDDCLIGIGAVVLNDTVVGDGSIIGAGAILTKGNQIPPRSLVYGNPAKVIRELSDEEIAFTVKTAEVYVELASKQLDKIN